MHRRNFSLLSVSILLVACACAGAEETKPSAEDEAKIAAKEDAAGDDNMDKDKSVFVGLVALENSGAADDHGSIGKFAAKDGKVYELKAASNEILEKLKPLDKKIATIAGKLRVNGKYLVAMAVVAGAPNDIQRDKRKKSGL
ncbi:MAG TPA: hypothetical protein VKX17_13505 [Planctomycetota bacterium]|nr:hypothetical protein [Planctomycetota bacterium]